MTEFWEARVGTLRTTNGGEVRDRTCAEIMVKFSDVKGEF